MTKTPQQIGKTSRRKGQRIENEIVHLHQDNLIPAEKVSRGGYTGHDLMIADEFKAEVKARSGGQGFATITRWLGDNDLLFLREDGKKYPTVVMRWQVYQDFMNWYLSKPQEGLEEVPTRGCMKEFK